MYCFEGEFRSRPQQNLGGASNQGLSREQLLQRNQQERKKRELNRKQNKSATVIQAQVKSFLIRKKLKIQLRTEFKSILDSLIDSANRGHLDLNLFNLLSRSFAYFYDEKDDTESLYKFGQLLINQSQTILKLISSPSNVWLHRIKTILIICIKHLNLLIISKNTNVNISLPLRIIDIYTSQEKYQNFSSHLDSIKNLSSVWKHLIKKGFFYFIRSLLELKTPQPFETTIKPLTPLGESLYDLTMRPLNLKCENYDYLKTVNFHFFNDYLIGPFSPQIQLFMLPSLTENLPYLLNFKNLSISLNQKTHSSINEKIVKCELPKNIWTLYSLVKITANQLDKLSDEDKTIYLYFLNDLIDLLSHQNESKSSDSDGEEFSLMESDCILDSYDKQVEEIIKLTLNEINSPLHVNALINLLNNCKENDVQELLAFSYIGYSMLSTHSTAVHEYRFLYSLAYNTNFLRKLWFYITTVKTETNIESGTLLLNMISRGIPITEWKLLLPQLSLFCALFNYLLPINDDYEIFECKTIEKLKFSTMPFCLNELKNMIITLRDTCLGLIDLAYLNTKYLSNGYKKAIMGCENSETEKNNELDEINDETKAKHWSLLFKNCVKLLRQIHNRDSRNQICPEECWISKNVYIPTDKPINFKTTENHLQRYKPFIGLKKMSKKNLEEYGPPMSVAEIKNITILQEIPFVVPFTDRVKILQLLMSNDKRDNYGESHHFDIEDSTINLIIRRNYIYEDAFEKLSPEREPDIKKHIRVQLKNAIGLEEAGIDGGGLFREFLSELIKSAFDPNRGFFKSTSDCLLYPNPSADLIEEDYLSHYYFIGRILGKAIYENMLTELPFSHSFLAKILTKHQTSDIDIHHLASLDPLMYKNLLYLKNYKDDVSELGIDFTVIQNDLGENKVIELKPNGSNILVTAQNRIEYIHLMADYRLNKQIRPHCSAFKMGLACCIDLDWIRMFSTSELQILISGAETGIDIEDLKQYTIYSGGYHKNHPIILAFWEVVENFNESQRRQLLKFVTSCSRAPLLGFKQLNPPFCIQFAGTEDRLPTASTCMNLLKLPGFSDTSIIKQKLTYAIESAVGFELS